MLPSAKNSFPTNRLNISALRHTSQRCQNKRGLNAEQALRCCCPPLGWTPRSPTACFHPQSLQGCYLPPCARIFSCHGHTVNDRRRQKETEREQAFGRAPMPVRETQGAFRTLWRGCLRSTTPKTQRKQRLFIFVQTWKGCSSSPLNPSYLRTNTSELSSTVTSNATAIERHMQNQGNTCRLGFSGINVERGLGLISAKSQSERNRMCQGRVGSRSRENTEPSRSTRTLEKPDSSGGACL